MEYEMTTDTTPSTSNPQEFMGGFLKSEEYNAAYSEFYAGKTIRADITEETKHQVFQDKEPARLALIRFAQNKFHFLYTPEAVDSNVNEAVGVYENAVMQLKEARQSGDRDRIINQDALRSSAHNTLADLLTINGIAPSRALGLGFAGLILVSRGLQEYDSLLEDRNLKTQALYR